MLYIGCHLSVSDGYEKMGITALQMGANTFQFFTRNPRGGKAREIKKSDFDALSQLMTSNSFAPVVAHAPYTLNACSADERTREFAFSVFADDIKRMENLPGNFYNFHPGSHVGQGVKEGISLISQLLNTVLTNEQTTLVLLETMSGKGSEIGGKFEELREIINCTEKENKLGVCLDTCHVYDAGYDIVNDLDGVLTQFDKTIGLKRLMAVHLNDSMNPFSSHKDRHQKIGEGSLGIEAIKRIINHPALNGLPFCLETPNDNDGYMREIELLKALYTG